MRGVVVEGKRWGLGSSRRQLQVGRATGFEGVGPFETFAQAGVVGDVFLVSNGVFTGSLIRQSSLSRQITWHLLQ